MAVKLGIDGKLYFCAAGIGGTPTWTEVTAARDVTATINKGEADVTTRGGGGWKAVIGTVKEASIEFDLVWDSADAGVLAFLSAFLSGAVIGLAAADGVITTPGTLVFKADCAITKFDKKEPLENAQTVSITAKPTYSTNHPTFAAVPTPPGP